MCSWRHPTPLSSTPCPPGRGTSPSTSSRRRPPASTTRRSTSPSDPDQLAYILFTSGSTGRPKGVEVLRGGFANFLRSMAREPGLREDDRFLAVTTTTFDISGLELFGPLWVGGTAVIVDRQTSLDPRLLCSVLERARVTVLQATPATWGMLVGEGWTGSHGLRMLCGGEALSRDLADRLLERGSELWNLYGPTETTVWSTLDRVHPDGTPISIGRPIDRTRVCVLDEAGHLVPPGVVGEIFIGGDGVARGYRGRPDLTAERFLPDPFGAPGSRFYRTGDLGRLLDDGRFECLGRTDHQVKVRGFRIELGEVEAVLRALAGVREVVVVAARNGTDDPRLVAYWVGDASRQALQARAREALPPYMVPSAYARLEAFPLTTSGKVDRKALPRPDDSVVAEPSPAPVERPRNDTETRVASVWREILGLESVGIDQEFFALGGTSLLAVKARSLLEREFGHEIPLRAFFENPTVRSIADQVGATVDPDEPIVAWLGRTPVGKPPLFCVFGIQLYQDIADSLRGRAARGRDPRADALPSRGQRFHPHRGHRGALPVPDPVDPAPGPLPPGRFLLRGGRRVRNRAAAGAGGGAGPPGRKPRWRPAQRPPESEAGPDPGSRPRRPALLPRPPGHGATARNGLRLSPGRVSSTWM